MGSSEAGIAVCCSRAWAPHILELAVTVIRDITPIFFLRASTPSINKASKFCQKSNHVKFDQTYI